MKSSTLGRGPRLAVVAIPGRDRLVTLQPSTAARSCSPRHHAMGRSQGQTSLSFRVPPLPALRAFSPSTGIATVGATKAGAAHLLRTSPRLSDRSQSPDKHGQALKHLALAAIQGYLNHISPYEGFCCAYRAYTGHRSCSTLGYRAIRRFGVWDGLNVLRKRFERCRAAFSRCGSRNRQKGFCDIACPLDVVSCDLPSFDCGMTAIDALNCCSTPLRLRRLGQRAKECRAGEVRVHPARQTNQLNEGTWQGGKEVVRYKLPENER